MDKKIGCLAVLAALSGAAQAQSGIVIYGSFDGGVRHLTNVDAAGNDRLSVSSNGTYNANRLGFKGVEDLGGGMNAHFTLESGFNTGTGALDTPAGTLFQRTAAVGIGGAWGSLDLGRQYTVAFKTMGGYEPLGWKYPGVALAVAMTAGAWRATLGYAEETQETGALDTTNKYVLSGLSYRFTPALSLTGAYYQTRNETAGASGKRHFAIVSAVYSLSKRTDLYLGVDRATFRGTMIPATAQTGQTGVSAGVNHFF